MERKSELTKALLGENFKTLVTEKPFDKITIKMITDAAGVIRPTFYNYFQDKYEVMEWLLSEDVFKELGQLIDIGMEKEAIKVLFRKLELDKSYYKKAFMVEGQNSFEDMLYQQVCIMARKIINRHPLKLPDNTPSIDEDTFLRFQAITLVHGIKCWLTYESIDITAEQAVKFYEFLMSHSLLEILDDDLR